MPVNIDITDAPSDADRAMLLDGLRAYNQAEGGMTVQPIAVWVRDDHGEVTGGLTGRTGGGWLFIEFFWLPEEMRRSGIGARVIHRAEEEAVARGCIGAWLDTFSFQAPGFYERQGYSVFGALEDYPSGGRRYFMQKRLDRSAG